MTLEVALGEFLDRQEIGEGPVSLRPIGEGHSNLTFLLRRGEERLVLRRPPLGDLSPSANDLLREAGILGALEGLLPVPRVLVTCDDTSVLGAPFFVASFVDGLVIGSTLPAPFRAQRDGKEIARLVIETLVELHAVDLQKTGLEAVGRPDGYLSRQLRRFTQLLDANATRPLPELVEVGEWLTDRLPKSADTKDRGGP